ncbi:hypothetical protein [Aquimarina sediminis]|uniref:hypothetical protein n=1 Tax=Aquimarina sediminis TaxID=2070536 RepID=UPI000FFED09B|nr:hypothetical protein [Aquimarina sediminis]
MNKYFAIFVINTIMCFTSFSQDLFVDVGINYTKFDYKNSLGDSNIELLKESGLFFATGVSHSISSKDRLYHLVSLNYNQYNSRAFNNEKIYSWETSYIGIQNMLKYKVFEARSSFSLDVAIGLNISHIVYGRQTLNNKIINISSHEEFSGIFLQPVIGLETSYKVSRFLALKLGYNYSIAFNTKKNIEKLKFLNNQVFIGVVFPAQ